MFPYTAILVLVRLLLYTVMFSCMELVKYALAVNDNFYLDLRIKMKHSYPQCIINSYT